MVFAANVIKKILLLYTTFIILLLLQVLSELWSGLIRWLPQCSRILYYNKIYRLTQSNFKLHSIIVTYKYIILTCVIIQP